MRKLSKHFAAVAALAIIAAIAATARVHAQGMPPTSVIVSPVIEQEVAVAQTFVGTVMPSRKAIIGSAVDGRVIDFPLNEGDRVAEGQPLAQLLTDTITLEIAAAEADLELRRHALAELENGTRPEEIEQAKARMDSADARMKYLTSRRARWQRLFETNRAVSEEELEETVSSSIEAEQAYREAKAAYDLAIAGPRVEQIAQARAQVAVQQATVDQLKDRLSKHTIISRFDGYVTAEHTEVGQWVQQGDPVAEVAALDEVEVTAYVVEQHVPHIRVGGQVLIEVPALPGQTFPGIVCEIVPQADVQARTFPVKVHVKNTVTNSVPLLKSGMYARVLLPTGEKQLAKMVPKDSLVLGGAQPLVFVVATGADGKMGKVTPVPVRVGVAEGGMIQVTGPLEVGQLIVIQGNERLQPGEDVAIQQTIPAPTLSRGAVSQVGTEMTSDE